MCSQVLNNMNHGHRLRHAVENTRVIRRKFMKHMVEKRRRNRINDCLENMRSMVLAQMGKNPSNYTKMEKADILEMTVKFVENLKKKPQQSKARSSPEPGQDFERGYKACQHEISRYLDMAAFPQDLKIRLNQHLQIKHSPSASSTTSSSSPRTLVQPKVVPPQEFTAMLSRDPSHQPISARDQYHVSPPMVLHPSAYHPHYMHSPHYLPAVYPQASPSGVLAVAPAAEAQRNPLCQPLSIEIKPEAVSPPSVDNVPRMQPPAQGHPDSDDDVWRPW